MWSLEEWNASKRAETERQAIEEVERAKANVGGNVNMAPSDYARHVVRLHAPLIRLWEGLRKRIVIHAPEILTADRMGRYRRDHFGRYPSIPILPNVNTDWPSDLRVERGYTWDKYLSSNYHNTEAGHYCEDTNCSDCFKMWCGRHMKQPSKETREEFVLYGQELSESRSMQVHLNTLSRRVPTEGARLPKAILSFVRKIVTEEWKEQTLEVWESFFSAIGSEAARGGSPYTVVLSVAPSSFWRLGHYGEPSGCCFAWGREYEQAPIVISQHAHSYVGLIYDGELEGDTDEPVRGASLARFWGYVGEEYIGATNLYKMDWQQADNILRHAVAEYLGMEPKDIVEDRRGPEFSNDSRDIYCNGDGRYYCADNAVGWDHTDETFEIHAMPDGWTPPCADCGGRYGAVVECADTLDYRCEDCSFTDNVDGERYSLEASHDSCEHCGGLHHAENLRTARLPRYNEHCQLCTDCAEMAPECADCNAIVFDAPHGYMHEFDGDTVCQPCAASREQTALELSTNEE